MFEGFQQHDLKVGDVSIRCVTGGKGPPLLLLHGYPQTHAIWHKVGARLAERYTVVATDLRGYGDSSKPAGLPDHSNYSKRVMARDQVRLMEALGFPSFAVVGHDRGGRVAHRLARDHHDRVTRLWERIEAEPKSRGWKLRDRIGDRKQWYEEPEEVER